MQAGRRRAMPARYGGHEHERLVVHPAVRGAVVHRRVKLGAEARRYEPSGVSCAPGDPARHMRSCQWPDGCNHGALREVDTGPIGHPGKRWLCLRHAGRVWNERKRANRAAGLCPCGAPVTPGRRTCARCREGERQAKRLRRAVKRFADECGIVLPRQAGRRRAFFDAYRIAFSRCQDAASREWRRRCDRALRRAVGRGVCSMPESATSRVSVSWEGRAVTCEATFGLRGVEYVCGVPGPE